MQHLSARELQSTLTDAAETLLLDVREPWEFEICSIEGSVNVPMHQVPQAAGAFDRDAFVVTICHHGVRSMQVADYLERQGFTRVANLEGGVDAWAAEVEPGMDRY